MFKQRFNRWINRRIPPSDDITLAHHNLFILPSRFGLSLLLCIVLLFLLGTNYQNNPVLLLSYLLLAWMLVAMILCFLNLKGNQIHLHKAQAVHRGQHMEIPLSVTGRKPRVNWRVLVDDELIAQWPVTRIDERNTVYLKMTKRGLQRLPRLRLETRFPFGLFVCWTYLRFEQKVWVFPKVDSGDWHLVSHAGDMESSNEERERTRGQDVLRDSLNFEGIREHQVGESLSRVSWKHQARNPEAPLLVKDFSSPVQTADWLTFQSLVVGPVGTNKLEQRLERLTFALLQLDSQKKRFGLSLSGYSDRPLVINVAKGEQHLQRCLKGLAAYGQAGSGVGD